MNIRTASLCYAFSFTSFLNYTGLFLSHFVYNVLQLLKSFSISHFPLFQPFDRASLVNQQIGMLHSILDFEHSRNHRQGSELYSSEVGFTRWFPVAFLTNGVLKDAHGGSELTTPVL